MIAWGTQKSALLVGAHRADTSLTKGEKKKIWVRCIFVILCMEHILRNSGSIKPRPAQTT